MKTFYTCISLFFGLLKLSYSQTIEIEKLSRTKPLKVSGGLNASTLFTQGMPETNSPLNYFLSGYLNFTAFRAVNIPVMINYSDRKVNLSQGYSFNQISIHPTYKWATAHIGTTNMTFSPYTLNGHQFTGAGLELSPKNWRIQVMNGRLLKGQFQDTLNTGPTFKRMGFGYRIEYNPGKFLIGTTLFQAKDQAGSVPQEYRAFNNQVLNPQQNTVVGLHFGATIWSSIQLSGEYSNSLLTKDSSALYESVRFNSLAGFFTKGNPTSQSNHALKLKANYNIKSSGTLVGIGYERIDPNYKTLGGYYFVDDLINYTFSINQNFSEGKYIISSNVGIQKDDIKQTKINKQNRFVGSLNVQANVSKKLNMGFMFSNFQSYRFLNDTYSRLERVPGQIVDTLNFSLVSTTLGYNVYNYFTRTEDKEFSMSFNTNYVSSYNLHGYAERVKSNIINSNVSWIWGYPASSFKVQVSLSHFFNGITGSKLQGIGPNLGLQKTIAKKLMLSMNTAAMQVEDKQQEQKYISLNTQMNSGWAINTSHKLNLTIGHVKNQQNNFLNGNLAYNYTFK
jgi:hypothetical protein